MEYCCEYIYPRVCDYIFRIASQSNIAESKVLIILRIFDIWANSSIAGSKMTLLSATLCTIML